VANAYNANPIFLTATMASGWKGLQTLNTGNLTSTAQQLSGAVVRQPGIRISKVVWLSRTASQPNSFTIIDPVDSTVLLQDSFVDTATTAPTEYDFADNFATWKDFKLSALTSGTLLIYYR
jgi:hypothetical protein